VIHVWAWPLGGAALAAAVVLHGLLLGRLLGVSGLVSALTDRLRRVDDASTGSLANADLLEALRAETVAAFGEEAVTQATEPVSRPPARLTAPPLSGRAAAALLVGLGLGGFLAALGTGTWSLRPGIDGTIFAALVPAGAAPLVLLAGGVLVGVGTRMAGGCTSGHGLSGVARLQPGSLVATASFFGAAIAVSFALEVLR